MNVAIPNIPDWYDDTAICYVQGGEVYNENTGEMEPGAATEIHLIGRYETNIKDSLVKQTEAQGIIPKFIFWMPLSEPNLPIGATLKVLDKSSGIEYSGKIQMFNKGNISSYAIC